MLKPEGHRWQLLEHKGMTYITVPHWHQQGIINAFSCRTGGCSLPPFDSLNMALHCNDYPANVLENRRRLLEAFGLGLEGVVCGQQVHGSKVQIVEPHMTGSGADDPATALPECDATVCDQASITLMSFSADCLLLLFVDPVQRVIANAHAGWKGTHQNIASKTALCMIEHYNSRVEDLEIFIGPGIGPCCFEISPELAVQASPSLPESARQLIEERDGRIYWDLPATNHDQLIEIGVSPEKIISPLLCTSCHPELFYSYRREKGVTGRMASLLNLVSKQ